MITVNEVKFGLLLDAIKEATRETCTSVWCDNGYSVDAEGNCCQHFCKFYMSFSSNGDIDEDCATDYAMQIESTARMVKNLNAFEFVIALDEDYAPMPSEEKRKVKKILTTLAEIEFEESGDLVEGFLRRALAPTKASAAISASP